MILPLINYIIFEKNFEVRVFHNWDYFLMLRSKISTHSSQYFQQFNYTFQKYSRHNNRKSYPFISKIKLRSKVKLRQKR